MSVPWRKRKAHLGGLLNAGADEDAEALALDRIMHGQNVIGKTSKTTQIDSLRFTDNDLSIVGTLSYGQFGVIDVVTCKIDGRVYVRKSIEKRAALKTRDQCSPQLERDILLQARKTNSEWAPHILCAFQTPTHLNLVMDYAEGGSLWDVLESSPYECRILESDLKWWTPQIISAIHWCHSQGFVHRDVKPHNFVLTPDCHVLLIDFGSAAPLLPCQPDGSQRVPKQHCLVPCGTCDYISPEILETHEEALVALEMEDDAPSHVDGEGYGRETDWWSMGAMLYEMAYGVAPFFADDIRQTYVKITEHYKRKLKFDKRLPVSAQFQDFIRRLLTIAELRLGRGSVDEIMQHPFFEDVNWSDIRHRPTPSDLHLPQFTYTAPANPPDTASRSAMTPQENSRPFAFSALFESSPLSALAASTHPTTPSTNTTRSILREHPTASFIGFSWGPTLDAFDTQQESDEPRTPKPPSRLYAPATPFDIFQVNSIQATPGPHYPFATPIRPSMQTPYGTLPRPSTIRRTAPRRAVSDREAWQQLVNCVGLSARKRVLESGRKPRKLGSLGRKDGALKELRFDASVMVAGDGAQPERIESLVFSGGEGSGVESGSALSVGASLPLPDAELTMTSTDSDAPPSPSPTPRPGSAMSMMSKRSQTPTITSSSLSRTATGSMQSLQSIERRRSLSSSSTASMVLAPNAREDDSRPCQEQNVSDPAFDALERRFVRLVEDIEFIEGSLSRISRVLNSTR